MSTYYYLGCDQCQKRVPIWGRWVGGPGVIPTARKFPDSVQDFIHEHERHGIAFFSEHEDRSFKYADVLDEWLIDETDGKQRYVGPPSVAST